MNALHVAPVAFDTVASSSSCATDLRIRAFLDGETNGEDVLDLLYGAVADEPVPASMLALLRR